MQRYGFDFVNRILRPWPFLYWPLKKTQFTISIATCLCWAFPSKPAPLPIRPGWTEAEGGWRRLTYPGHSFLVVLWRRAASLSITAHSFVSFPAVCTWPTETNKWLLDQQLRANNSRWVTLRGCGTRLPYIPLPSPLLRFASCLRSLVKRNQQALGPASQITLELQRLLCNGRPWRLFQLE